MQDFFRLLAELDIGHASFIALIALVFWLGREMVKALKQIEHHVAQSNLLLEQTKEVLGEVTGFLQRKGIEVRSVNEVGK